MAQDTQESQRAGGTHLLGEGSSLDEPESSLDNLGLSTAETFSSVPQQQASSPEETRKRARTSHHTRKSERTIRRHKREKKLMEAKGFLLLPDFFKRKAEIARQQEGFEAEAEVALAEPAEAATTATVEVAVATSAVVAVAEEEEEDSVVEVEASETMASAYSLAPSSEGDTMPMHAPSPSDPGDFEEILEPRWGPSWTILYEESEESSSSCGSDTLSNLEHLQATETKELDGLRCRNSLNDGDTQQPMDSAIKLLRDRAGLEAVQRELSLIIRQKKLDTVLRGRVVAMVGLLTLYLDSSLGYTWKKASEISARVEGRGITHTRTIRQWVLNFVRTRELPAHQHGRTRATVLDDEDIAHELKLALHERGKKSFLTASDVVEVVSSPEMQAQFAWARIHKPLITERTVCCWLNNKLGWRYGRHQNGMYINGHEREDVVDYRKGFVERFKQYERRFHAWDDAGNELPRPSGFLVPGEIGCFHLILITHDESVFYQNNQRKIHWGCPSSGVPKPKGGVSLMVSDFLTADWGRLRDDSSEARVLFRPGKNRDGWFTADNLLAQVDNTITIFEGLTRGYAQGLFLFDNAPSHQKHADDAISARKMVKAPKKGWTHHPGGPRMRSGKFSTGNFQSFY